MNAKNMAGAERRAEIIQQLREHKITSFEALESIKKLEAEIRRKKKKSGVINK